MSITLHKEIEQELKKHKIDCKFTFINGEKTSDRVVVICIFRLNKPYRDDESYINGLLDLVDIWSRKIKNHHLRIYYDDSVYLKDDKWKSRFEKLKGSTYVELIHYDFPQFKGEDGFHRGLFGTIIRMLCFFDFDKSTSQLSTIDIDFSRKQFAAFAEQQIEINKHIDKYNIKILLHEYDPMYILVSGRLLFKSIVTEFNTNIRIMMPQAFINNYRFNKTLIIDFLKCLLENCESYKEWVNDINSYDKKSYDHMSGGITKSRSRSKSSAMRPRSKSSAMRSRSKSSTMRSQSKSSAMRSRSKSSAMRSRSKSSAMRSQSKSSAIIRIRGGTKIKYQDLLGYNRGGVQLYDKSSTYINSMPYGVDEFFINCYVLYDILKNKIPFYIYHRYMGAASIHYIIHFLYYNKVITEEYTISFYKEVLGNKFNKDIHKSYEFLDNILYKNNDGSRNIYDYKIFTYLANNNIMNVVSKKEDPIYVKLIQMYFDKLKIPYKLYVELGSKKIIYKVIFDGTKILHKKIN